jgi:7tm Odorant receptor
MSLLCCHFLRFFFLTSYGFEFSEHWLAYIAFIGVTIPHMLLVTLAFYGIDIFFVNILIFCTSFMKYVQCEVEHLKDDLNAGLVDDDVIRKRVSRIVRIHAKGIELAEKLENILNVLMLVLYSVNTMVLCFLFFEFHIVRSTNARPSRSFLYCLPLFLPKLLNDFINFLKVSIFFGVVQTLLVLFSYFGTKLMEEVGTQSRCFLPLAIIKHSINRVKPSASLFMTCLGTTSTI